MGFLRGVQGVTLRDKVHRFEICKAQNVKAILPTGKADRKMNENGH